jgi:hypothetical protein
MFCSHGIWRCCCVGQLAVGLPCFSCVLADIGDEQSLTANLSTFSGHIKRCVLLFLWSQRSNHNMDLNLPLNLNFPNGHTKRCVRCLVCGCIQCQSD